MVLQSANDLARVSLDPCRRELREPLARHGLERVLCGHEHRAFPLLAHRRRVAPFLEHALSLFTCLTSFAGTHAGVLPQRYELLFLSEAIAEAPELGPGRRDVHIKATAIPKLVRARARLRFAQRHVGERHEIPLFVVAIPRCIPLFYPG